MCEREETSFVLLYYYHGVQQYLVRSNNGVGHPSTIARAGALIFKDPFVGAECESLSNAGKKALTAN